jgi:hypothetical protein
VAFEIMGVIEGEVLRPVARLAQIEEGLEKRRVGGRGLNGANLDLHAIGQMRVSRQHHHAVFDSSSIGLGLFLRPNTGCGKADSANSANWVAAKEQRLLRCRDDGGERMKRMKPKPLALS